MKTVHLILNAHIDPVWLWPWQAGLDEVIATCRSACDRLDTHPDLVFSRGEAWAYQAVERTDPALFERVRAHVEAGRWEIVGGWWIQPDCNLPTLAGMRRQIELGRDYFLSRFGRFPRIGFNVDSFGHAAALPGLMRGLGQDRYVMMRPQEHEMALPARLFRWRGDGGGEAVSVFRIARSYSTNTLGAEHVLASLEGLPDGVSHTMCFVGLGDHGGGPTETQIQWCRDHAEAFAGCRLVFSSPSRFFDAVEQEAADLPMVTGELQHHAVGCYSVLRAIKTGVRRAEEALQQAEVVAAADPRPEPGTNDRLTEAWRQVAFNQFHDTLGGTSIPSAYEQARDQLGGATAFADEMLQIGLRRMLTLLPDDHRQRIALFNASSLPFEGYAELAPWTEAPWAPHWRLLDETGAEVVCQRVAQEAATRFPRRILTRVAIGPGRLSTLTLDRDPASVAAPARLAAPRPAPVERIALGEAAVDFEPEGFPARLTLSAGVRLAPKLTLLEDLTDTWSHGVDRLDGPRLAEASWSPPLGLDVGPLMVSGRQEGVIGPHDLIAEWRIYRDEPIIELRLRVHWRGARQLLKLVLPLAATGRIDGVMGDPLRRALDGRERSLQDFTLVELAGGGALGVVCPDVFALDASPQETRLTLLRAPLMAHHDPSPAGDFPRALPADQGPHEFRFQFAAFEGLSLAWLRARAAMIHRPLIVADWTRGMRARSDW